jgi:hypothetical protein
MSDEEPGHAETSSEDKREDLPTLPAETSIDDSSKSAKEKKVVVVKPGESDVKISDRQDDSTHNK